MIDRLDLIALRYYVAVVEHGSYSRAASKLRLTQPAVSRQIQNLERAYKVRLLKRNGQRFEVTEAGKQLFLEAKDIIARVDRLEHLIGTAAQEPSGTLSVGVTWATSESLLPELLMRFRSRYPKVFIRVIQDSNDRLADALAMRRLDIAVLFDRPRESQLEFHPLVDEEAGLIVPHRLKEFAHCAEIDFSKAFQLPIILPHKGWGLRDVIERQCAAHEVQVNVTIEADNLPITKRLVLAGLGYTIATRGSVQEEASRSQLRFVAIRSPSIVWKMHAAMLMGDAMTMAQKAMLQELQFQVRRSIRDSMGLFGSSR